MADVPESIVEEFDMRNGECVQGGGGLGSSVGDGQKAAANEVWCSGQMRWNCNPSTDGGEVHDSCGYK